MKFVILLISDMMAQARQKIPLPGLLNNPLTAVEAPMANAINHTIEAYAPSLLDREIRNTENRIPDMRLWA